jgi:hypothetical protein
LNEEKEKYLNLQNTFDMRVKELLLAGQAKDVEHNKVNLK